MATWQNIVDTAGRRLGDESTTFKNTILFSYCEWVVRDMAQAGCLDNTLRRTATFNFTASVQSYAATTITGESEAPLEIRRLFVPAWGWPTGIISKVDDDTYNSEVATLGPALTGRPLYWRTYPNVTQVQVFPIPDADNSGASFPCTIEYTDHPTAVGLIGDTIVDVLTEELPALVAGVYWMGALFTEETHGNVERARDEYEAWKNRMLNRHQKDARSGRAVHIKPRQF